MSRDVIYWTVISIPLLMFGCGARNYYMESRLESHVHEIRTGPGFERSGTGFFAVEKNGTTAGVGFYRWPDGPYQVRYFDSPVFDYQ